ncbi:MAG: MotA/TolQ/ExbB proton channel family protein [Bacteroidales bacterium]|nr:MotA/TolQ/ExbB proton channel family protein [Bacteroidales bacterium]
MKKLFVLLSIFVVLSLASNNLVAQEVTETDSTEVVTDTAVAEQPAEAETPAEQPAQTTEPEEEESLPLHQVIKQKFIEGGPMFMSFVLLALILGLAICIERIIYLNLASTNSEKLLHKIEEALASGGVEAAKEVCRNTRGPVASIFYQGLDRYDSKNPNAIEMVEKTVIAYGGVQMGLLEKGITWIALFIAIAPMLGFMGTVIGMIDAFDSIQKAGDVSAGLVAGGIKVALITTVSGLIVAMILQVFYNYIVSKIDGIVNDMEDASISLVDIVVKHNQK